MGSFFVYQKASVKVINIDDVEKLRSIIKINFKLYY